MRTYSNLDYSYIYSKLKEQKLENIAYYGLVKCKDNSILFHKLQQLYYKHLVNITNQDIEYNKIVSLFDNNNIDYVPLKGISVKKLYPYEDMRLMGDIDILIRNNQRTNVRKLLTQNSYILDKSSIKGGHHEIFDINQYGHFEIHYKLFDDKTQTNNFFDKNVWNETNSHKMSSEFNLCYQLAHYYKHFYHGGASLKSLIDITLLLEKESIIYDKLKMFLLETNYYYFYCNVVSIINHIFNKNYCLFENTLNEDEIKEIIDYIFVCGDFGFGQENDSHKNELVNDLGNKKVNFFTKLGYIIKKVCIPYSVFKDMSKLIKYVPILLPFGWIVRFFRYLFKHDKKEIKQRLVDINNVSKEDVDNAKTIHKFLNIDQERN